MRTDVLHAEQQLREGGAAALAGVGQELQRLRAADKEVGALRVREARLQSALAEKSLENLEMRWRLAATREAASPSLAQVGGDPGLDLGVHFGNPGFVQLSQVCFCPVFIRAGSVQ